MGQTKQELFIKIVDARKDPPEVKANRYTDHKAYLRDMGKLSRVGGVHRHERTETTVTLYPERTIPNLFD